VLDTNIEHLFYFVKGFSGAVFASKYWYNISWSVIIMFIEGRENMKRHSPVALILLVSILLGLSGGVAAQAVNAQAPAAQQVGSSADPLSKIYLPLTIRSWPMARVGMVTDIGGVNDNSFNTLAWKGITDAQAALGVSGRYLESSGSSDYAANIQQLLNDNQDLIVTVGFLLGVDTANAAKANPNRKFAIVDYTYPDCWPGAVEGVNCGSSTDLPNVRGLAFQTDQAGFLAGYLAAGMTKTGKVGTYGGMPLPTVTIFMKGYQAGVKYYNKQHSTSVVELGWDNATQTGLFTNNFGSFDLGVTFATNLVAQGADIIFPVAGPTGFGSASYCQASVSCLVIGVDTDWFVTAPEYASVELSSVLKKIDVAVYKTIQDVVNGTFTGGTAIYDLGDNGVDLAPFHNLDSQVPLALKNEIAQAKADLISGAISVDGVLAE
jgi:basic membrane protein A